MEILYSLLMVSMIGHQPIVLKTDLHWLDCVEKATRAAVTEVDVTNVAFSCKPQETIFKTKPQRKGDRGA